MGSKWLIHGSNQLKSLEHPSVDFPVRKYKFDKSSKVTYNENLLALGTKMAHPQKKQSCRFWLVTASPMQNIHLIDSYHNEARVETNQDKIIMSPILFVKCPDGL